MSRFYSFLIPLLLLAGLSFQQTLKEHLPNSVYFDVSAYKNVSKFGNALLRGMDVHLISVNATPCYNSWINFYFKEMPIMQIKYHYGNINDNIFNTTKLIKNITSHLSVCTHMAEDFYNWGLEQSYEFNSPTNYFASFFQNILANLMNINHIYQEIMKDETKRNNMTDIFYNIGKIIKLVIYIKPVEEASLQKKQITRLKTDGLSVLKGFDHAVDFVIGIVNGTYPQDGEMFDECRAAIDLEWYTNVEQMLRHVDNQEIFEAIYLVYEIIGSVDTLAHSCFEGFEDTGRHYYKWIQRTYATGEIWFNALIHSGNIADDIVGLIMFFTDLPWAAPKTTFEAGHLVGDIIAAYLNNPRMRGQPKGKHY